MVSQLLSSPRNDNRDALVVPRNADAVEHIRHKQSAEVLGLVLHLGSDVPLGRIVDCALAHQHAHPVKAARTVRHLRASIGQDDRDTVAT